MTDTPTPPPIPRPRARKHRPDRVATPGERQAARMARLIAAEKLLRRYVEIYGALPD